tara:strand:- start:56 stop:409 length:354 start_codon:yes stop_codon:yes gene_type:complete
MNFIVQILLIAFIGLLGILSLSKTLGVGDSMAHHLEVWAGGDKALHFWGAGIITFLLCRLWGHRYGVEGVCFWVMCALLAEERLQSFFPTRHFNLDDVGAGCAGVIIFGLGCRLFFK